MSQMGLVIILCLLIWGWAEMSTFIYIGSEIGGLFTLLGVFVTAIFGITLLKRQGSIGFKTDSSRSRQGTGPCHLNR
jgi:UPF0716 family protein affecting phage T7 exclusion